MEFEDSYLFNLKNENLRYIILFQIFLLFSRMEWSFIDFYFEN